MGCVGIGNVGLIIRGSRRAFVSIRSVRFVRKIKNMFKLNNRHLENLSKLNRKTLKFKKNNSKISLKNKRKWKYKPNQSKQKK